VWIRGRAKRFAKVGGEMISLAAVEELAGHVWPRPHHAVVSVPDERKGEQLIMLTEQRDADRHELLAAARARGMSELHVPRRIIHTKAIPLLGTGKVNYPQAQRLVQQMLEEQPAGAGT
jgi:acyl-[acyl-carrier-protein]-phospholipid O-acyltransferase/long-chain-fatty-acid--[acyl-carrier-protein] ligase